MAGGPRRHDLADLRRFDTVLVYGAATALAAVAASLTDYARWGHLVVDDSELDGVASIS